MHFYSVITPPRNKKPQTGDNASVLKFSLTLAVMLAAICFCTWQRAQNSQNIRELRKEIKTLQSKKEDLEKTLQNRGNMLEHLMEGSLITQKAKPFGLRPPTAAQRVHRLELVYSESGIQVQNRLVGYNKR